MVVTIAGKQRVLSLGEILDRKENFSGEMMKLRELIESEELTHSNRHEWKEELYKRVILEGEESVYKRLKDFVEKAWKKMVGKEAFKNWINVESETNISSDYELFLEVCRFIYDGDEEKAQEAHEKARMKRNEQAQGTRDYHRTKEEELVRKIEEDEIKVKLREHRVELDED